MLRTAIQAAALMFLAGAAGLVLVQPAAWPILIAAGILILGTLFERFYYRGGAYSAPGGRWQATAERFRDEESGGLVTVWFNPETGERRYVEEGAAPPA
jgi:hypothetical protein